jgi:ABC-2 type transport system permease protein
MKSIAVASLTVSPRLQWGPTLSALGALFGLTLRQHARGRRLLILSFLFLLPTAIAVLVHNTAAPPLIEMEFVLVFHLIPHALVPLAALLYASGMIADEQEEQTLTYLLVRPLPKRALYLTKLAATICTSVVLTAIFTAVTYVAIYWGTPEFWSDVLPVRLPKTVALLSLSLVTYCSVFACMSLLVQRSLVAGVAYILIFEGLLANIDFVVRRLTVMYYFRVLSDNWIGLPTMMARGWSLDANTDPTLSRCVLILLGVSLMATTLGALTFARREFRVKTPEGS